MTVSTTTSRIVYAGNGVTTIFAFPYRFLVNGDLDLTLFAADGTSETLVLTTDYTVTGADSDAGGSVTMVVAPASGETLVIRRVVDLTQETDYISGDAFPAESHERALDKLTMSDQQLQEQVNRSLTFSPDEVAFSGQLPPIVAERFLRVNDSGTAIELVTALNAGELVVSPFIETLLDDANAAAARTTLGAQVAGSYQPAGSYAASGAVGSSGLTMATARVLGRITAATGAPEELTAAQVTANFVDAATDTAAGKSELATSAEYATGTDTTRVLTPAAARAENLVLSASQSLSGVQFVDFTGIPSWVKRIVMNIADVSSSGNDLIAVLIGDAGGIETTGYAGSIVTVSGTTVTSSLSDGGLYLITTNALAVAHHGRIVFEKLSGNAWCISGIISRSDSAGATYGAKTKTLSAALDRVRISVAAGTFDAGLVSVIYE